MGPQGARPRQERERWRRLQRLGRGHGHEAGPSERQRCHLSRSVWERITAAAEKYNEPGKFTAFIGFEWSATPDGNNLHRNIIFRDGKAKADQIIPFSQYDSVDPEDLWRWMSSVEQKTGARVARDPAQRQPLQRA